MLKKFIIHPFLIAVLPVVLLYRNNIDLVQVIDIIFPLIINLGLVITSLALLLLLSKNRQQAAIESTIFIFVFSTCGSSLYALHARQITSNPRIVFILYGVIFIFFTWINYRKARHHSAINEFLNIFSIVLFILSIGNIIPHWLKKDPPLESPTIIETDIPSNLPDIYYIILDGYGGDELLSEIYNFNNTQFISMLKQKGFYVVDNSISNYYRTVLSLNSTLNIQYLENNFDWDPNLRSTNNNYVNDQFKYFGYNIYTIHNYINTTEWAGANILHDFTYNTAFFRQYISTTVVVLFWPSVSYEAHRYQLLDYFDSIERVVEMDSPKFVFAHVVAPHTPFVFDKNGNSVDHNIPYSNSDGNALALPAITYQTQYIGQVQFINLKISQTIDSILEHSTTAPIIIIQGDHGPGSYFDLLSFENNQCFYERFSILNAFYFPDGNYENLYEGISSVNTFRVVLSQYYGIPYDLLEDRAYYLEFPNHDEIYDVTDSVKSKVCNVSP
jgi:hypothetical protein